MSVTDRTALRSHSSGSELWLDILGEEYTDVSGPNKSGTSDKCRMQHVISAHREREKQTKLSNYELASLLGYDPATFDPRHDKPRFDNEAEMDRYEKLPLATKVKRLEAALSHSKQGMFTADLYSLTIRRPESCSLAAE